MTVQPTIEPVIYTQHAALRSRWWQRARLAAWLLMMTAIVITLAGRATVDSETMLWRQVDGRYSDWSWNLIAWEANAIGQKLTEQVRRPAASFAPAEQPAVVQDYLARAAEIGRLEEEINRLYSTLGGAALDRSAELQQRVDALRAQQALLRPATEVILESQIGSQLIDEGVSLLGSPFPPVWFTFTEPPMKLVVSPRSRIMTAHYAMLEPGVPAAERERIETEIFDQENMSAYATNIGGLGAYPTQVIDRAPLEWVLSTIAHEWVHNYLTLSPLGLNYETSPELTIMNETVADIVGDEIGRSALERYYPQVAVEQADRERAQTAEDAPPPVFDFRKEMRHTREIVDQFLALGRVEDAEEYMEIRRLLFVENGYALRKLNQAYFAFHGNYGTGAAATSPIGPKLEELRSLTPDVRTFLETVRGFTSPADLDRTLEAMRGG